MTRRVVVALALGIAAVDAGAQTAAAPTPVVVELFTSEGCSSCPPADALLQQLAASPPVPGVQVIALGEHVDYWDALGWKDRFSSAALTARQQAYGRALEVDDIYTPQLVVDGRQQLVGSDAASAKKALTRAAAAAHGRLTIDAESAGGAIQVGLRASDLPPLGKADRDEFVVAITEDGLSTRVRGGENHGRTLSHVAVVRSLATVDDRGSAPLARPLGVRVPIGSDWRRSALTIVAFVQEQRSRRIVAAASRPVPDARP
jgi:hypothetical protein